MRQNQIFARNIFLSLLLAALAAYFQAKGNGAAAATTAGAIITLWFHSGRQRPPSTGAGAAVVLLTASLLGACDGQAVINFHAPGGMLRQRLDAQANPIKVDLIEVTPQNLSGLTCPSGKVCLAANSANNRLYSLDGAGNGIHVGDARSFRALSSAPSGLAGDVYYDTTSGTYQFYSGGGFGALPASSGGTGVTSGAANRVFATPNGSSGAPTLRDLVKDDIPWSAPGAIGSGTPAAGTFTTLTTGSVALSGSAGLAVSAAVADGSSAVVCTVNNTVSLSNAAARLQSWQNNGAEAAAVRYDGALLAPSAGTSFSAQHAFPSGTGALCSVDATQTLSNKTVASAVLSGTVTGAYTLGGTPTIPTLGLSGTVGKANGGTAEDNSTGGTANTVWARPNGSAGAATYRALVAADLPATAVTPGSYTNANITILSNGTISAASNGSAGGSSFWHAAIAPAAAGAYDCEFTDALTGGWSLTGVTGAITSIATAPASLKGGYGRGVGGANGWYLLQAPADSTAYRPLQTSISLGSTAWMIARVSWTRPAVASGLEGFIGLYWYADAAGSIDTSKDLFVAPQIAGTTTFGKHDSGYTAVGTLTAQENFVYLALFKNGSDYSGYIGTSDGNMIYLGTTTITWTPAYAVIVVANDATANVVGVDFVRSETGTFPKVFGG